MKIQLKPGSFAESLNVFLILVTALFLTLKQSPWHDYHHGDSEVFRYMGMLISHGGVPYRDAFDHKPPLIFFLAALFQQLDPWGLWLWDLLFLITAAVFLWLLLKSWKLFCPVAIVILWMFLQETSPFVQAGGNTRSMAALLIVITICLLVGNRTKRSIALAGISFSGVFWLQQNEVLGLCPYVVYALTNREDKDQLIRWRAFLGGFTLITLLIWGYFFFHSATKDLFRDAFFFNFEYYLPELSLTTRFVLAWDGLKATNLLLPISISLAATILAGLVQRKFWSSILIVAWCGILTQILIGFTASGRGYGHYFQTVIPHIAICIALSFKALQGIRGPWIRRPLTTIILLALVLTWPSDSLSSFKNEALFALRHSANPIYEQAADVKLAAHLREIQHQPGQLFVMRNLNEIGLYADYDVLAPTRIFYTHFWDQYPSWDFQGTTLEDVCNDLDRWQTKYIVDFSDLHPLPGILQPMWITYRTKHYRLVTLNRDRSGLWKRQD